MTRARFKVVLCLIAFFHGAFFLFSPPGAHAAVQNEIDAGENDLYSETISGILQAHAIFQNAKASYPDDPVINMYLALTRMLNLSLTSNSGGLTDLLSKYGIIRSGSDLDTLKYTLPRDENEKWDVPETAPLTESVRSFVAGPLLSALDESIFNLNKTIAGWSDSSKHIVSKEKRNSDHDIEVDLGDIYLFRAALKELKSLVLVVTAYDLNVDLREIAALDNSDMFSERDFLNRYQDFLKLIPTSSTPTGDGIYQLALARTAMIEAIEDYVIASQKIRNDKDLSAGAEELLEIDECDYRIEEWFRDTLVNIRNSLNGTSEAIVTIADPEERWVFTDMVTNKRIQLTFEHNLSKGKFFVLDGHFFYGSKGSIQCVRKDAGSVDNVITFDLESSQWPYSEFTFSGSYYSSDEIRGTYSGWSLEKPTSGSFAGTRIGIKERSEKINLNPFFGNGRGPYDWRDFLPRFNECDEPIPGTVGSGLNPGYPVGDATLGGIIPSFTQDDWNLDPVTCSSMHVRASPVGQNVTSISNPLENPDPLTQPMSAKVTAGNMVLDAHFPLQAQPVAIFLAYSTPGGALYLIRNDNSIELFSGTLFPWREKVTAEQWLQDLSIPKGQMTPGTYYFYTMITTDPVKLSDYDLIYFYRGVQHQ